MSENQTKKVSIKPEASTERQGILKVAVIGFGNAGCQTAQLAFATKQIPAIAINSSSRDLDTITSDIPRILIGSGKGAGKDRDIAKEYFSEGVDDLIQEHRLVALLEENDVIFLVGSTSGGTASGMLPIAYEVFSSIYPTKLFILSTASPSIDEALGSQTHDIEFFKELQTNIPNAVYMCYDNDNYRGLPNDEVFNKVNTKMVEDMAIIRGDDIYKTSLDSIDENDLLNNLKMPGRLVVGVIRDIKELEVKENLAVSIKESITKSAAMQLENDHVIAKFGVISTLHNKFDKFLGTLKKDMEHEFGMVADDFSNNTKIEFGQGKSSVSAILTGLSFPESRFRRTIERKQEIEDELESRSEVKSCISDVDTTSVDKFRKGLNKNLSTDSGRRNVDTKSILDKYKKK